MKRLKSIFMALIMLCSFLITACTPPDASYTVTLMDGTQIIKTIEKDKDTHLDAPDAVVKAGYTFIGWYVDAELTTPYEPAIFSANLTLYAKYDKESLYITFNLNGGAFETSLNNLVVRNGENYSVPTPTKEGYNFVGWTVDGETFASSGVYERSGSVRISANWAIKTYTVTFKDGNTVLDTETVEHGKKVAKWNSPTAGYEVAGWYADEQMQTAFDFNGTITSNTEVFVDINAKTYNIIVNEAKGVNTLGVYGQTYQIETPERTGYTFTGFTRNGQPFPATGTYNFTSDIIVTATWERDADYWKSTVSLYDGNVMIDSFDLDDGTVFTVADLADALADAEYTKTGYTFNGWYSNSALTEAFTETTITVEKDVVIYAKFTANPYKITVDLDGGLYNGQETLVLDVNYDGDYLIPAPNKNGYKLVGFTYDDDDFSATGKYKFAKNIEVKAVWERIIVDQDEEGTELFVNVGGANGYYKERKNAESEFTYVFLAGVEYDLTGFGTAVKVDGVQKTSVKFDAVEEDITLEITKNFSGTIYTYTRSARVVEKVYTFGTSGDYNKLWGAGANRADFYYEKADASMSVGAVGFKPDVAITKGDGTQALTMESANVTVVAKVDGVEVTDYEFNAKDGEINFGDTLVGKTVELTFAPKYSTESAIVMNVKVNNGVNVYNNEELRTAYSNRNVSEINILRGITAQIGANDYVAGTDHPINKYEYGVYTRKVSNANDSITINGNFFTIDGSKLPLAHNGYDGREWGVQANGTDFAPYYVNNTQIGFFLYNCADANDKYMGDGQATFNDLFISGNVGENPAETKPYNGKDMLIYSGAYHGIVCRGGRVSVNNTTIYKTNIAIFADADVAETKSLTRHETQFILNGAKLDKSWGNQVYVWGFGKVEISNSYLGTCGGAAIHLDDLAVKKESSTLNAVINVDRNTKISNYVVGTETWFVSRGMGGIAPSVKGELNGGLQQATTALKSMMPSMFGNLPNTAVIVNKDGVEKMNFALLVRSGRGEAMDWVEDNNGSVFVETNLPVYFNSAVASKCLADLENNMSLVPSIFNQAEIPSQDKQTFSYFEKELTGFGMVLGYVEVVLA